MRVQRMFPSSQVSQWFGGDARVDLPSRPASNGGWVLYVEDPLTTMGAITAGANGAWTISTYLRANNPTGASQMRAMSTTLTPTSPVAQLIEVEFEIPSSFSNANNDIIGLGWLTTNESGQWCGIVRGDNVAATLQDAIVWGTTSPYIHPPAGVWVKLRVLWDHSINNWKIWCDGVLRHTATHSRTFAAGVKPALYYANISSNIPGRFRNLKAWYQPGNTYTEYPSF